MDGVILITVSTELLPKLGADTFALKMTNDSMIPEFRPNEILVIDPSAESEPGNYVAVKGLLPKYGGALLIRTAL